MKYRTALIGTGSISRHHAEAIISSGNMLVAACDTNPESLENFCNTYNCRGYEDFEKMLEAERIDALHICLPHYLHFDTAAKALEKNIAVFLEKPPVTEPSDFEKLVSLSEKGRLTVCFQNRLNPTTLKVLEIINSGIYGKLLGANASVAWCREGDYYTKSDWRGTLSKECGGVLINQAIHTLDLLCFLLGTPTAVSSAVSNLEHPYIQVEDTVSAVIHFGDKKASFFATTCAPSSPSATITLVFEKAKVTFDNKTVISDGEKIFDVKQDVKGKECWGNSHTVLIDAFYKNLDCGKNPVSITDCADTMKVLFCIYGKEKL